uniref:Uncharacterized protein n=1 Tax=Oryza meridionalis TaxID=40149 RepID=A0A0E0EKZ2_9ORYZ
MDEALDRLLEKFELMEAKRRQEEKIDKLLEMFELREKRERESMLEISAIIRATTAVFKSPSSPSTPASPLVPARCSTECLNNNITWVDANSSHNGEMPAPMVALELGDSKDKDPATYIVTKDLPMVTPTRCSLICSSSDVKPDLIVNVVLASSRELVLADDATDTINIGTPGCSNEMHAKCLTLGLDIKGDPNQAMLTFQTMMGISKVVPSSVQPVENFLSGTVNDIKLGTPMLNTCLPKCPNSDNKLLMEHTERNPWPAGVTRRWEEWHVPWSAFNSLQARVYLLSPWPPLIQEQWDWVNHKSCTINGTSSLQKHTSGLEQIIVLRKQQAGGLSDQLVSKERSVIPETINHKALGNLVSLDMAMFWWSDTVYSEQNRHTISRIEMAFSVRELDSGRGSHTPNISEVGVEYGLMWNLLEVIRNANQWSVFMGGRWTDIVESLSLFVDVWRFVLYASNFCWYLCCTLQSKIKVDKLSQEPNETSYSDTSIPEKNTHVLKYLACTQVHGQSVQDRE